VGQRPVTQTLKNALASGRVAHAFLFAGPRGVGKTTVARILAKALNCEKGPAPEPCDECLSCQEIAAGRSLNCMEIDGASNRGIDEVRELRENVRYSPGAGKHKVVIIDEVHMLTEPAFNALLKTLEEPPPRVVFILATTEPHKVPATIRSRCQRYDFKRIGVGEIVERLRLIAREEGVKIAEDGLTAIARAVEGSLRDAQSLLDQAISYSNGYIGSDELQAILGLVEGEVIAAALQGITERDAASLLELVDSLHQRGQDLRAFCLALLEHLRHLMVLKVSQNPGPLLGLTLVDPEILRGQAERLTLPEIELLVRLLSQAEQEMRRAPYPRFVLEVVLVRMAEVKSLETLEAILGRLAELEKRLSRAYSAPSLELPLASPVEENRAQALPKEPRPPLEGGPSTSPKGVNLEASWAEARQILAEEKVLSALLAETRSVALEGDLLVLTLDNGNAYLRTTLEDKENRGRIEAAVSQAFGKKLKVTYRYLPPEAELVKPKASMGNAGEIPEGQPRSLFQRHPLVQEALELFRGRIIEIKEGPQA